MKNQQVFRRSMYGVLLVTFLNLCFACGKEDLDSIAILESQISVDASKSTSTKGKPTKEVLNTDSTDSTTEEATTPDTTTPDASSTKIGDLTFVASQPVYLKGVHNTTIQGKWINGGTDRAITLVECSNIHITKNFLENTTAVGIYLQNCKNITIDYNYISNVSTGVYVVGSADGGIKVDFNQFKNMQGPAPRGQFVQFNNVNGVNNSISFNKGENILNLSYPEDAINLYMSNGTAASPIQIKGNQIRGGGPSKSGGGIVLGDKGGSFQIAQDNILVDPGQYGMGIAGGDSQTMHNNQVYGKAQPFTNVGMLVWGQGGYVVTNATVTNNKVYFERHDGVANHKWKGKEDTDPIGWRTTNTWGANINSSLLPDKLLDF